jgi:hypothetical protein
MNCLMLETIFRLSFRTSNSPMSYTYLLNEGRDIFNGRELHYETELSSDFFRVQALLHVNF